MFSKKLFILILLFVVVFLPSCTASKKVEEQKEKSVFQKDKQVIFLPEPKTSGEMSVEEAIVKRRSRREFTSRPLTLEQIGQLLWTAQGITDKEKGLRSAPSAGALYPLEIYLLISEKGTEGLNAGVYHYLPEKHGLEIVNKSVSRQQLAEAALGQSSISQAPVSVVITAVYERTIQKYGERGEKYVHIEAGHVGQNVYLQAESLGLGTVVIGAFNDERVREILNLAGEEPLCIMPFGYPE